MQGPFTEKARQVIENAKHAAATLGHDYVGTEHLLIGLISVDDSVAARTLVKQGVSRQSIEKQIEETMGGHNTGGTLAEPKDFTPKTKRIFELSYQEATRMGVNYVGTEHILIALMREHDSIAVRVLSALNVDIQKMYEEIMNMLGAGASNTGAGAQPMGKAFNQKERSTTPFLDRFSRDLTKTASSFDPIVGRNKEIDRVIQILSRRTKNNPCLVGDPGVGKTAIAEGLAQRIQSEDVPEILIGKRLVAIDLPGMVAGTKYRGEFEERIKRVMEEVITSAGNIILFIDELHTIIGAGGAEGAIDAANILKPALARGEIQLIGATTLDEYRKYIEKDAALERRFQPVSVEEPSEEEAIEILLGIRDKYEAHHGVKITDSAARAAVRLSARYISDRFLPDKAIDLLDEASSKVRLRQYTAPPNIKELSAQIADLDKEKEEAIKTEEFEKAGVLKQKQEALKTQLQEAQEEWRGKNTKNDLVVDDEEIADVVASWTGIPVRSLQEEETKRLLEMEKVLHKKIIGQNQAVTTLSKAIRRGRVGLKDPKRPIGSFMFLGPTGVGKTSLCKALAEILFGDENAVIRIDMSEYMERHTTSKLIGAPPGFVGYNEGGQLSEKVRRKPYSVVLFDEIEKAHPDVFNILLQMLDDGHITDAQGRKIDFKNTVIIMTSNAGARSIINPKRLGFVSEVDAARSYEDMKKLVMDEVRQVFRPEFLNRVDDIIVFHPLDKDDVRQISLMRLDETAKRVQFNIGVNLEFTSEAKDHIAEAGYDPAYGARPLLRVIQTKIEDEIAEAFLKGEFKEGDLLKVGFADEKIVFDKIE